MRTAGFGEGAFGGVRGRRCLAEAMNRPVQRVNGGFVCAGAFGAGARKSLEPIVERLGADGDISRCRRSVGWTVRGSGAGCSSVAEAGWAAKINVEAWCVG